jgi:hypothetical protein
MTQVSSAFLKWEEEQGYSRDDVTITSGQNLEAGTVLGKVSANGKYVAYDNDATNGSEVAAGVLLFAVDATSADTVGVAIKRAAIVATQALVWGAGVTTQGEKDAALADLELRGIVARTTV